MNNPTTTNPSSQRAGTPSSPLPSSATSSAASPTFAPLSPEAADLAGILISNGVPIKKVLAELLKHGHSLSRGSLTNWRRNDLRHWREQNPAWPDLRHLCSMADVAVLGHC